jgi:hypothetical protein
MLEKLRQRAQGPCWTFATHFPRLTWEREGLQERLREREGVTDGEAVLRLRRRALDALAGGVPAGDTEPSMAAEGDLTGLENGACRFLRRPP